MRVTSYQGRGSSVRGVTAQWNSPGKKRGYISQRCHCTLDYFQQEKGLYQLEHIEIVPAIKGVLSVRGVLHSGIVPARKGVNQLEVSLYSGTVNSPGKKWGYISQSTLDYSQQEKGLYQLEHIRIVPARKGVYQSKESQS